MSYRRLFLLALLLLLALPSGARAADALWYEFSSPFASATGPHARIFDWTTQKCIDGDIPDQAARAWRDSSGQVTLVASHAVTRRRVGSTLENGVHQCTPVLTSSSDSNPANWDYAEWLSAPYTPDGRTVYSLVHEEYRGWLFEPQGYCIRRGETWPDQQKCWYNAITFARSTDGGATFTNPTPPTHYVASVPYRYTRGDGPIGIFNPSNIVRGQDGYLYSLVRMSQSPVQSVGTCLLRTRDISDPTSWRAWNGSGFTVRFLDPYVHNITNPAQHSCAPLPVIDTATDSLTWSTYFKRWLLLGPGGSGNTSGFHAYTSDDLINWRWEDLMMRAELPWTHVCSPPEPDFVLYPSVLDPNSKSRNFETIGQRPYLYFTHFNVKYNTDGTCGMNLDRDLIRVPIEFSNQQPGGPAAALSASSRSVRANEPVTFDASGSRDADGAIAKYEWDLDGDGAYERSTGTNPVARSSYPAPDDVTVTVRVWDDDGKATDDTVIVRVAGGAPAGAPGGPAATAAARPGAAAVARFRLLGRLRAGRDGRVLVRVHAPAAGRLAVRGRNLRAAAAHAARAGVVRLRVRLARRVRGKVRAVITFTPVGGARQSQTVHVRLTKRR